MQKTPINSLITDDDWDADAVLVLIVSTVLFFLAMTAYSVLVKGAAFDPATLGTGIAAVLGGGGFGYMTKRFGDKRHNDGGGDDGTGTSSS